MSVFTSRIEMVPDEPAVEPATAGIGRRASVWLAPVVIGGLIGLLAGRTFAAAYWSASMGADVILRLGFLAILGVALVAGAGMLISRRTRRAGVAVLAIGLALYPGWAWYAAEASGAWDPEPASQPGRATLVIDAPELMALDATNVRCELVDDRVRRVDAKVGTTQVVVAADGIVLLSVRIGGENLEAGHAEIELDVPRPVDVGRSGSLGFVVAADAGPVLGRVRGRFTWDCA